MEWVFPVVYIVGALVTAHILRRRAGITHSRRIKIIGEGGVGVVWFAKSTILTAFWPIPALVWLVRSAAR